MKDKLKILKDKLSYEKSTYFLKIVEECEQELVKLTQKNNSLRAFADNLQFCRQREARKIEELEKENKEIRKEWGEIKRLRAYVLEENKKLKLALKGLNECFDFEIDEETETIYCCLGDVIGIDIEFLKLLKELLEVLKDDET